MTPKHYRAEVSPWDLQKYMFSSGNAFVDGRRCDAIKYIFRNKESLLEDLKKAKHCLEAAIERLETEPNYTMNELFPFMCELCGAKYTEHPKKSCVNCDAPATRINKYTV